MASYKVNQGISTSDNRFEAGDVVDGSDIPATSIKWLTEQGIIELVPGSDAEPVTKKSKRSAAVTTDEGGEF
jgi:hypothetical protein